jgi:hypothetical protein
VNIINRNVSIVVVILVLVVIAGYLVWLRSKYQPEVLPKTVVEEQVMTSPTPIATSSAKIATQSAKEATGSMKQ